MDGLSSVYGLFAFLAGALSNCAMGSPFFLLGSIMSRAAWRPWNRQQRRVYHRTLSCLSYWVGHDFEVIWFMLSSRHVSGVVPSDEAIQSLTPDFERLRRMIERKFGFKDMEFLKVLTREGGGVIHGFMAYKVPDGGRKGRFFIPQRWLSAAWGRVHGARYVWVSKFGGGQGGAKRVARYLAAQYLANQDVLVRCSYSWSRTFGFPLVKVWRAYKRWCPVKDWGVLCAGGVVASRAGEGHDWSLSSIRAGLALFLRLEKGIFSDALPIVVRPIPVAATMQLSLPVVRPC